MGYRVRFRVFHIAPPVFDDVALARGSRSCAPGDTSQARYGSLSKKAGPRDTWGLSGSPLAFIYIYIYIYISFKLPYAPGVGLTVSKQSRVNTSNSILVLGCFHQDEQKLVLRGESPHQQFSCNP